VSAEIYRRRGIALLMRCTGPMVAHMTILASWPGRILIGTTMAGASPSVAGAQGSPPGVLVREGRGLTAA
jgi:hypothetical protein